MFLERLASQVITAGWKTITKVDGQIWYYLDPGLQDSSSKIAEGRRKQRTGGQQANTDVPSDAYLYSSLCY